jgi:hypothetical protein
MREKIVAYQRLTDACMWEAFKVHCLDNRTPASAMIARAVALLLEKEGVEFECLRIPKCEADRKCQH